MRMASTSFSEACAGGAAGESVFMDTENLFSAYFSSASERAMKAEGSINAAWILNTTANGFEAEVSEEDYQQMEN